MFFNKNKNNKVYCIDCQFYQDIDACYAPKNTYKKDTYLQEEIYYIKNASVINFENKCKWYK